jgi:cardiolipin synthase
MPAKSATTFNWYTHTEYWPALRAKIDKLRKGDRMLLATMTFQPDEPEIALTLKSLYAAAGRGVYTALAVDAHDFMIKDSKSSSALGPLWYAQELPKRLSGPFAVRLQALQTLQQKPTGRYTILNLPQRRFTLPIAGRSHIKLAIVNDEIFIGGCNMQGTNNIDAMVSWNDPKTADWLYITMQASMQAQSVKQAVHEQDQSLKIDPQTTLFVDAGVPKQSAILHSALQLIDAAREFVIITCQYFPNSVTAQALKRAHARGVKVRIVFPHPSMHGYVGGAGQQINMFRESLRVPKGFFTEMLPRGGDTLHAKLLITDTGTMIGSHNYVAAGVLLGTAEIALLSRDKDFAKQALKTLKRAGIS